MDEPSVKRQKYSSEEEKIALKITDLNDSCLKRIFDLLEFNDFLNVASSNKTLNYAACLLFKQKYGSKQFTLNDSTENKRLLHAFSKAISSIKIQHPNEKFTALISKNSFQSLNKVEFCFLENDWLSGFPGPLPKVESVDVRFCNLSGKILLLSKIFPELRNLSVKSMIFQLVYFHI